MWDFASAFSSVAHACLFCVLDPTKLWRGFIIGRGNLYIGNRAFGQSGGVSGTLSVLVIDPLL